MLPQQYADMLEQVMNTILYPARWFKTILDYTHMRMVWWGAIFGIMLITLIVSPLIAGKGNSDKAIRRKKEKESNE